MLKTRKDELLDELMAIEKREKDRDYSLNQEQVQTNMCARAESPEETIDYLFTFHDDPDKTPHYIEIREAAKTFAKVLIRHCPGCADRTTAIRKVREAVMTANAAVALSGRGL
jgi:hypothetical protein